MKKILSLLLVSLFVLSALALTLSAGTIETDPEKPTVYNIDMLDFEPEQNAYWAAYDETTGKWSNPELEECPWDEATEEQLSFMLYSSDKAKEYLAKLDWGFTENGEVLHVVANNTGSAGFGFTFYDGIYQGIPIGSEASADKPLTEYFKIRFRNYSSSNKITFAFNDSNINSGNYTYAPPVSISDLAVEPNSSEWQTIVFSMRDINSNTNYKDSLKKDANGVPETRWCANLRTLFLFPFGFDTGSYSGATMDIDYIVFGSKSFVENYKSDLEIAEEKVEKIELIKAPSKTTYYVGENIDLSGLELKATYNDGTSEILTSVGVDYKFEDASDNSVVTLKYGKATATYSVKVIGLEKIEIASLPEKTTYKVSEISDGFVPTGLTAKATFADGNTKVLSLGELNLSYEFIGSGTQNVSVNYHGAKAFFTIDLINIQSMTVEPLTTPIYFGTKLTADDLTINVVYSDESTDTFENSKLDKNYITAEYNTTYGETEITVTYSSPSLEQPLVFKTTGTYAKPVSLEASSAGVKTEYEVDDTFDSTNLQLSLVYENGKKVNITVDDLTQEPVYDFSSAGDTTVTFNFEELSASIDVNVKAVEIVTRASTTGGSSSDGAPIGLIVGIVAAVLVIGGVVVFVVLKKKKQ